MIERNERLNSCFKKNELYRRIDDAVLNCWYIPVLANNDITRFEAVRNSLYKDSFIALKAIINTLR